MMNSEGSSPRLTPLQVRQMQAADLGQVVAIERSSFSHPWSREQLQTELDRSKISRCYVAEFGSDEDEKTGTGEKQIAGFLTAWLVADEMHITNVAVHPGVRGRGIARGLLEHVLGEAYSQGGRWCQLEVRAGNAAARGLYGKMGFEPLGVRSGYYSDGEDAVVMGKELDLRSSSGV